MELRTLREYFKYLEGLANTKVITRYKPYKLIRVALLSGDVVITPNLSPNGDWTTVVTDILDLAKIPYKIYNVAPQGGIIGSRIEILHKIK